MTDRPNWPPIPTDRVRHSWRCTRQGPRVETIATDATGGARVVTQCTECGYDDLAYRLTQEATP